MTRSPSFARNSSFREWFAPPAGEGFADELRAPVVSLPGHPPSYQAVAWCYDAIAAAYSLGRIERAKAWSAARFGSGDRVLYAGIGSGSDALMAARRGADVVGLDLSPAMLARSRQRFDAGGCRATLLCQDFMLHESPTGYDGVVANFVLDVYSNEEAVAALEKLTSLVRPGGLLAIADFAAPRREGALGVLQRGLSAAYYRPVNGAAWLLGLARLHPLCDYAVVLERMHFEVRERRGFLCASGDWPLYESIIAVGRN